MDYWRRAAGKSRLDRVRNESILDIMKVDHRVTDDIKEKPLRWYGHVQRMGDERLPKQVLHWMPHGRRRRGRPRLSWREGITGEMRARGMEENLWEDRERWRLEIRRRRRTL
ncbi:uncharacterized protein LOC123310346 [Coccinella septempunctata]|uniref:uncharacterized protein LOC123310346 n=1 Tax=Coccinella septempunctata TaxID=41139 RepID=UPI001D07D9DC|nr:uncharacterized protein LOC123310346 [Coccinella septempunctata]